MKNYKLFTCFILIACSVSCKSVPTENNTVNTANVPEGQALMTKSDCMTCHNYTSKIVGPAFFDIAAKYTASPENEAKLTARVLNGGSGIWGTVPMPAHPGLSKEDAGKMIGYILSLKDKK